LRLEVELSVLEIEGRTDHQILAASITGGDAQGQSLSELNAQLDGERRDETHRYLTQIRALAVERVTGNRNIEQYDVNIAAVAERDGVSYNKAVENRSRTTAELNIETPLLNTIELLPWEVEPIQSRVDSINARYATACETNSNWTTGWHAWCLLSSATGT